MNTENAVALLAVLLTFAGNIWAVMAGNSKARNAMQCSIEDLRMGLSHEVEKLQITMEALERKQDKHNGLIERMVVVEQSCKSAHHRIDDLFFLEEKEK